MKMIYVFFGILIFASPLQLKAAEKPEISRLSCSIHSPTQVQIQSGPKAVLESPLLDQDSLINCHQVQWRDQKFVAIHYKTQEHVSYSASMRRVNRLHVYHWVNNQLRPMLSHPINNFRPLWTTHRGYLVLRIRETDSRGRVELTTGYLFNPARRSFEDFIVFGMQQGWPDRELR